MDVVNKGQWMLTTTKTGDGYSGGPLLIKNETMQYEINYLFRHSEIAKLLNWYSFATMQKELYAKDRNMLRFLENNTSIVI